MRFRTLPLIGGLLSAAAVENEATKLAVPSGLPVGAGGVEVGLVCELSRASRAFDAAGTAGDRGGAAVSTTVTASVVVGVIPRADLGLAVGWATVRDDASFAETSSGPTQAVLASTILLVEKKTWAIAVIPRLDVPIRRTVPDDRPTTGATDAAYGFTAAATWEHGEFTSNVAAGYTRHTGVTAQTSRGSLDAGLAGGYVLTPWLQIEADVVYARELRVDRSQAWSVTGFAGFQIPTPAWRGSLGLSWTLLGRQADVATAVSASITRIW